MDKNYSEKVSVVAKLTDNKMLNLNTIKFKKLDSKAVNPFRAHATDAGADLTAISMDKDIDGLFTYGTGLAVEIPYGYVGLIFPRSSIFRLDLSLTNSVGVIDAGYQGEIKFKFRPTDYCPKVYSIGDRIGQLVIVPVALTEFVEVDELSNSERGTGGFGSTNNEKKPQS